MINFHQYLTKISSFFITFHRVFILPPIASANYNAVLCIENVLRFPNSGHEFHEKKIATVKHIEEVENRTSRCGSPIT